jgi:hypothetical protein
MLSVDVDAIGICSIRLAGELGGSVIEQGNPFRDAPFCGRFATDVRFTLPVVYEFVGIGVGRASLPLAGELAGGATGLNKPFEEPRLTALLVIDESAILGGIDTLDGIERRLTLLSLAGDAVDGANGLENPGDPFFDALAVEVESTRAGV